MTVGDGQPDGGGGRGDATWDLPEGLVDHATMVAHPTMTRLEVEGEEATGLGDGGLGGGRLAVGPAPDGVSSGGEGLSSGARAAREAQAQQPPTRVTGELRIDGVLGRGGLSVVHLATQEPLGREVAVKRIRPGRGGERARRILLREARVTGALAHPGVVPVHDVRWTEDGEPMVVLKRITGLPWSTLIHDPHAWVRLAGDGEDWLAWHLRVLLRVCEVVHFAHERGYLHRDIKPDNVMVGEQGEVTVVDWGLALRLDAERGDPAVPTVARVRGPAGTPAYMAPEMAGPGQQQLSRRTDVFLLGAVLYELVVGRPPYWADVDSALFARIRAAEVVGEGLPEGASPWLAAIVERAMQRAPEDRYESADALRRVVQRFLEHRGADALAREAAEELATLRELCRTPLEVRRGQVYLHYGKLRVGFGQALAAFPHHEGAAEGLAEAARLVAELELAREDPGAARLALEELDDVDPELTGRIATLERRLAVEEAERQELARRGRDFDVREGARPRLVFIMVFGMLWASLPWGAFVLEVLRPGTMAYPQMLASSITFTVLASLACWIWRRQILQTAVNRGIAGGIVLILVGQTVFDLGAWYVDMVPVEAHAFHMLLWTGIAAMVALMVDKRIAVSALGFLFGYVVALVWPVLTYPMVSVGSGIFTLNALWLWSDASRSAPPDECSITRPPAPGPGSR